VTIGSRVLHNHNKLLWQVEGADGVKTGFTRAAGRILVSSATRDGRRLICVTMNDPDDWRDHKQLLEDGFSRYAPQILIRKGQRMGSRTVLGGDGGSVSLLAAEDFSYSLAEGERVSVVLSGPGFAYAPVVEGAQAGYAHICVDAEPVGKVALIFDDTIEQTREPERSFWKRRLGGSK
jgi:D-alanyl-D-alanine carboxypeptidase